MKSIITSILALALFTTSLSAQEPSASEQRLRAQLKALTQRASTAETEQAKLQAEKTELEAKIKKLEANFAELTKDLNTAKEERAKYGEEMSGKLAEQEKIVAETKALLVKATKFGDDTRALLEKTEAERSTLKSQSVVLKRIVTDQRVKNAKMLETGQEILKRYEKFGLGTALTAREPFLQLTRAKLESMVDEYDGQLAAARIRLDGTSPKPVPSNERPADGKPAKKD